MIRLYDRIMYGQMIRILVVFTGGTIGCTVDDSIIDVDKIKPFYLLKLFNEKYDIGVEFDTIQPYNILSENIVPNNWAVLYEEIKAVNPEKYDGIIVTHGSDTLPYTSAVLGYLFNYLDIPLVVIGSNYPLEDKRSNGLNNFYNAVRFIAESGMKGVYAIFEDNTGRNVVYLSTRIIEADQYNDQFSSFGGVDFGEMKDGKLILVKSKINPEKEKLLESRERFIKGSIDFSNRILAIRPYPGLDYGFFDLGRGPKAVLHGLYHSGTACAAGQEHSLPRFIKKCREAGIDFYIASIKNPKGDLYASSGEIIESGAIPLANISFEAALAKLYIAYNQKEMTPVDYMLNEQYFEFLPA
ncbi:MAG: asparaginase [Clostridiaceae bacterium]|nr:asparaginase [Clostridiaceae bacterium]NLM27327.1 asparaginase [Clostridiaceae bacterium]